MNLITLSQFFRSAGLEHTAANVQLLRRAGRFVVVEEAPVRVIFAK